ncbi:putative transmembrane E3 ubiquitin-protein ligase 1 [Podospora australis]|uniref:RING-type E3 ubiquitin transferase n=1 Tax=Podospora australis TaxID=1536484 RepID=A0AAN7ALC5_9PEZI|nr:putative transmembrane E3 ubiquitin-protein ligase 1 [Podospora australis]
MPQQQPERGHVIVLFLILTFTLFSHGDGPALIAPFLSADKLGRLRNAHGVLNGTKWGDFDPHEVKEGAPPWQAPKYLNLTGFREKDGYVWDDLDYFQDRCRQFSKHAYPPQDKTGDEWAHGSAKKTWQNSTGSVQGKWVRRQGSVVKHGAGFNLSAIAPDISWIGNEADWGWNVTGSSGNVLLRFKETESDDNFYQEPAEEGKAPHSAALVREVAALATFQDEDTPGVSSFALRLHGVHWPVQGSMVLTTTSDKFAGIFGLPHLTPGAPFFETSQKLLNKTVDKIIRKKERSRFPDVSNPWDPVVEEDLGPIPRCEYIMYLQLHPFQPSELDTPADQSIPLVENMERELRFPTGAPRKATPDLRMSMVAWSPDCSYYLESKGPPLFPPAEGHHLVGLKDEVLLHRVNYSVLAFAFVLAVQAYFVKEQIKESSTPSTLSRLSFYTVAVMVLTDGMVFSVSSAWVFSATNTLHSTLILTFSSFVSVIISAGFLSGIYNHDPERRIRTQREQNTINNNAATIANTPSIQPATAAAPTQTANSLPLPVTAGARPPSPPIIIPSDQDIDAEIAENTAAGAAAVPGTAAANARRRSQLTPLTFYFFVVGLVLLILTAMSMNWSPRPRAIYFNVVGFCYFSLWCPQIWRNAKRNSRRSFAWSFIIGQSVCRLIPFAYFWIYEENFLFAPPDRLAFACMVGWVWVQICIMVAQDVWEPRLGIPFPRGWLPEVWDYHRVLRQDDIESGVVIGLEVDSVREGADWTAKARERAKDLKQRGMTLRNVDCAICRDEMLVPVVAAGQADPSWTLADMMERKAYMITPCRHMFHTKCLEQWFRKRLVCPICREDLQPL